MVMTMSARVEDGDTLGCGCMGCGRRIGEAHDLLCRRRSIGSAHPHHVHAVRVLAKELGYERLSSLVQTLASEEPIVDKPARAA